MADPQVSDDGMRESRSELNGLARVAVIVLASSGIAVVLAVANTNMPWLRSIGVVTLSGLVGLVSGAGLGFLFGIPRSNTAASATNGQQLYRENTNLEELSDWLTKIIVGLGLTQINQLAGLISGFRRFIEKPAGVDPSTSLICALVLVLSLVLGFLWLYLETRTNLSRVLNTYGRALLGNLSSAISQLSSRLPSSGAELASAAGTLKSAVELNPNDAGLRRAAARALAAAGRTDEAASILPSEGNATIDDQISRMVVVLYKPDGYQEALKISNALSNNPGATSRSDYWVFTACAFGQQHRALVAGDAPKTEIASARNNVIDCVRRAVTIDATEKRRLYWLAFPEKSLTPDEDDLVDFRDDKEFLMLVENGMAPAMGSTNQADIPLHAEAAQVAEKST